VDTMAGAKCPRGFEVDTSMIDSEEVPDRKVPERGGLKKAIPLRREYSMTQKLQVVRETLAPGASVSVVARRHDINSNVVFRWRREYLEYMQEEGERGTAHQGSQSVSSAFVSVGVVGEGAALRALPPGSQQKQGVPAQRQAPAENAAIIEIETALGVKVRITGAVDERLLDRVLAEIRRCP
jgi:transposase